MAMVELGVYPRRKPNSRKRSLSTGEGRDVDSKRRTSDVSPKSSYGCVPAPSCPVSSLYSHRDPETSTGVSQSHSHASHSRSATAHPTASGNFPIFPEEGYQGQYDHYRDYPLTPTDTGARHNSGHHPVPEKDNYPPMSLHSSPQTKRNRFNLSRYQLDQGDDLPAPSIEPEEKPNRFKTQRERLMLARASQESEEDEDSASTAPERSQSSSSQSQSQDSYMSQRERLRRFSSEHSRHVVVPNEWEGEQRLQEFVAFGNIEAALRPLGLMMARAALVSDSVTTRQRRSNSAGPSWCHTSLISPRTS